MYWEFIKILWYKYNKKKKRKKKGKNGQIVHCILVNTQSGRSPTVAKSKNKNHTVLEWYDRWNLQILLDEIYKYC